MRKPAPQSHPLSRLEQAVLGALADELRTLAPDLAGQVRDSRVLRRVDTGSGFVADLGIDRARPLPKSGPTGLFGTVHADVGRLDRPVAFQVQMVAGRLATLRAETYDEATAHVDFATAPFGGLFRIDAVGQSVAVGPTSTQSRDDHRQAARETQHPTPAPIAPAQTVAPQAVAPPTVTPGAEPSLADLVPRSLAPQAPAAEALPPENLVSARIGLWVGLAALALVAVLIFRVSIVLAGVAVFALGRWLQTPKNLARAARRHGQARFTPDRGG